METTTIVAFVAVGLSAVGIGLTIVVLLLRGSFLLGGSINQVNNLGKQVDDLTAEVKEQRLEHQEAIQRSNREHQEAIQRLRQEHQESIRQLREEMADGFSKLANAVNDLRAEVQQNNQMLAALANHTHDTDGRTIFTLPSIA